MVESTGKEHVLLVSLVEYNQQVGSYYNHYVHACAAELHPAIQCGCVAGHEVRLYSAV